MKYRVHIECRNEHMTECIAYVVQAENAREAKDRAGAAGCPALPGV